MKTAIIVPARLGSSRLPQKLILKIYGKPLLLWTAERIRKEAPEYPLFFAVDGTELKELLAAAGFEAVITDPDLPSGTDRIAKANELIQADRIINVQGDEPLVTGKQIRQLDQLLADGIDMATLGLPLNSDEEYQNPNRVKMVTALDGRALYFSRACIPYIRDTKGRIDPAVAAKLNLFIHIGLYAYTSDFLLRFSQLPPSPLEQIEKLEMLRALENGYTIATGITNDRVIGIDTQQNIAEFEAALKSQLDTGN